LTSQSLSTTSDKQLKVRSDTYTNVESLLGDGYKDFLTILDDCETSWDKRQIFRTEVEMRFSVLNDGRHPTPAGKYWQAVREQYTMYNAIQMSSFQFRREEINLARLERQMAALLEDSEHDKLDVDALQIDIEETEFSLLNYRKEASDRLRELKMWIALKEECVKADPTFDRDDVNNHQWITLRRTLENRKAALTPGSNQSEVINVLGPLKTFARHEKYGSSIQTLETLENEDAELVAASLALGAKKS